VEEKKALIVNIDGVPFALVEKYVGRGYMPNLRSILNQDFNLHKIDTSLPDISSVSWTTSLTGVNPREHVIYSSCVARKVAQHERRRIQEECF